MSLKSVHKQRELRAAIARELEGIDIRTHLLPAVRVACELAELHLFSRTRKNGQVKKAAVVEELVKLFASVDRVVLDGLIETVVADIRKPSYTARLWRWTSRFLAKSH